MQPFGQGASFGPVVDVVSLTLRLRLGDVLTLHNCTMQHADVQVQCVVPPGAGLFAEVTIAVLGQAGSFVFGPEVGYEAPTISSVVPASGEWPTDLGSLVVEVRGSGFGPGLPSSVQVAMVGRGICGGNVPSVTLQGSGVQVLADHRLVFVVPGGDVDHVVPLWTLHVSVSGQEPSDALSMQACQVTTRTPQPPSLMFRRRPERVQAGSRYFLTLVGEAYGPSVSALARCVTD